ncbi:MAG: hypothetical protein KDD69_04770 [Bdellovibrionales bacterium]|nr:hypothetical protein [Bdellovibrionales bacterium]
MSIKRHSLSFEALRERHPYLEYRGFHVAPLEARASVAITFDFFLAPSVSFQPRVIVPHTDLLLDGALDPFIFNLGLIELISYWKCACPREVRITAGSLSEEQVAWWRDLFLHGLGEFYFLNSLDFTAPDFLHLQSSGDVPVYGRVSLAEPQGDLVLVAGGKDSSLTLELLAAAGHPVTALIVNPNRSALASVQIAGFEAPYIVQRSIDPKLLELNQAGYLNGHTPFSAYLAFLGTLSAAATGRKHVIVSNEASADEENVVYRGLPINHQYSKSVRFEQRFRRYTEEFLTKEVSYFSFLRPLHDLQISRLFSRYEKQLSSFRSCNVGQRDDYWCGQCAKCAFVFLTLAPFVDSDRLLRIFGTNVFQQPSAQEHLRGLCGLRPVKPFECVGTREECVLALALYLDRSAKRGETPDPFALTIAKELSTAGAFPPASRRLLTEWKDEHFLPPAFEAVLRQATAESRHEP